MYIWQLIILKEIDIHRKKCNNITKHWQSLSSLKDNHVSCKVCLSVCLRACRGCSPGHVPERGPTPSSPNKGVYTNLLLEEVEGVGGVLRQAAISSRLNNLWPCSSAEPALSHALQLRVVPRRQWSEGQGSRRVGVSEVIWDANVMQGFHGVNAWTIRLLSWLAILFSLMKNHIYEYELCSLQPEHQHKYKKILCKTLLKCAWTIH